MTATTHTSPGTSRAVRTGLVLAVPLAIADVAAGVALFGDAAGTLIAVVGGLLAVLTVGALPAAWRGVGWALRTVAGTRLIGALTAVPGFFVSDVPAELVLVAAVTVVAAIVVAVLVLPRGNRS